MKYSRPASISVCAALTTIAGACPVAAQGPLTPPGLPAPIMKTLDQVEARTPIAQADLPLMINESGSYYVTEDLALTNTTAIFVAADHVMIDLNGFVLDGAGTAPVGIEIGSGREDVGIRDGTIRGFTGSAISASNGFAISCTNLRIMDCDFGVLAGGTGGLAAGGRGQVVNCHLSGIGNTGISLSSNSVVRGCTVTGSGFGIGVNTGSRVEGCIVSTGTGIVAIGPGCIVQDNICEANQTLGIAALAEDCRIVGNQVVNGAGDGLYIVAAGNYVADNIVQGNADNYDLLPGNHLNLLLSEIPEAIDWPASVKLAGTLTGTPGNDGITVNADDVTIDLDGHALVGIPGAGHGILVPSTRRNLTVRNGTIRNWPRNGISASNMDRGIYTALHISTNGFDVSTFRAGISAGEYARIQDCHVDENGTGGIYTSRGSIIRGCSARANGFGISSENPGISAGDRSTVIESTAAGNSGAGIVVSGRCLVRDNRCEDNTTGIEIDFGSGNRIQENHVTGNDVGIQGNPFNLDNLIIGNSAIGNTVNYSNVTGQMAGPIITGTGTITSENPWANFSL